MVQVDRREDGRHDKTRLAVRPMRTVRPADLEQHYVNPRAVLRDRAAKGEVHKIAYGTYVAVPDDAPDQARWRPGLEAAAAAVATAIFGDRVAVLMGMTAARLLGAAPRARGHATVAAPRRHRDVPLTDRRDAVIHFVHRDMDAVDTQPVATELGVTLITTPEQTLVDLARDRTLNKADQHAAMLALARNVDWDRVAALAAKQRGRTVAEPVLARVRREVQQ
ncbi:type IV toxin-antitoxin system AbiEi family antitoxin [Cellulomonas sp. Leaf395]|uniref:type IV toxin-antitoxin system AbiEi family antitoxin n=1 Tax=Cellulomonas sp. Leaf395 TaxID=1736362 RepID=UPI0009E683DA|nr:type IV toxin-antitoxin system AbiEi family antitoxin [Cellulomonas sp. Leaf395]